MERVTPAHDPPKTPPPLEYGRHKKPNGGFTLGCPCGGPETAHQLVNTGAEPLRYLAISTQIDPEICEYPDSGKIGAYDGDFFHLGRQDAQVDYWDGE